MMKGNEYVALAMRTNDGMCDRRLFRFASQAKHSGELFNGLLGLMGELGEFADIVKKWIFHQHRLDEDHLKKELGDLMWYVALICHAFEWELDEVMALNIEKLKARYPDGFEIERSQHRAEGDI